MESKLKKILIFIPIVLVLFSCGGNSGEEPDQSSKKDITVEYIVNTDTPCSVLISYNAFFYENENGFIFNGTHYNVGRIDDAKEYTKFPVMFKASSKCTNVISHLSMFSTDDVILVVEKNVEINGKSRSETVKIPFGKFNKGESTRIEDFFE